MTAIERDIVRTAYIMYRTGRITKSDALRLIHLEARRNGFNGYRMTSSLELLFEGKREAVSL